MPTRYLNSPAFHALPAADRLRAYLLLRTTPTRARVLQRLTGEINMHLMIEGLRYAGWVTRSSAGQYLLTPRGRRMIAESLPAGVLGIGIERPARNTHRPFSPTNKETSS